jgi:hypothetical protein
MRSGPPGIEYLEAASRELFGTDIGRANDDVLLTTHADIVRCYDVAITMAEAAANKSRPASEGEQSESTSRREAL